MSSDRNFRPVDMEFAPDGSLYIIDWHNALIGHMQHNARDVNRDHVHGRVYRITYPSRPLVEPARVAGAAAVEVLRFNGHRVRDHASLLLKAAGDDHGRVRMGALAAATWLGKSNGVPIMEKAGEKTDDWLAPIYEASKSYFSGQPIDSVPKPDLTTHLTGRDKELFEQGAEVFSRDGHCATCHQHDGLGLTASQFPPLAQSRWVTGNPKRLIKLALHGVSGPMSVRGVEYGGRVPMTAFKFLTDEELAAALTFARNRWGNRASAIYPETVKHVRAANNQRLRFWTAKELLAVHPLLGEPIVSDAPAFSNDILEAELLGLPASQLAKVAMEEGSAQRGKTLFYKSAACFVCHDPPPGAARLGPDLREPRKVPLSRDVLVDSILRPSKKIEREFIQWTVLDADGKLHVGIKDSENDDEIVLRNADQPDPLVIRKDAIEEMQESDVSPMPASLVRQLKSREEFNDLLRYILEVCQQ